MAPYFARRAASRIATILYLIMTGKLRIDYHIKALWTYLESAMISIRGLLHRKNVLRRPNILLGLSLRCNVRCVFCLAHSEFITTETERISGVTWQVCRSTREDDLCLDFDIFKRIVDDMRYLNPLSVSLTDFGEPLLYPRIEEALAYLGTRLRSKRITTQVSTNGILLTRDLSIKLLAAGIDRINISLNAASADTYKIIHSVGDGVFDIVVQNINMLTALIETDRKPAATSVSFVLCKPNFNEIVDMVRLCAALKIKTANFRFMYYCKGKYEQLKHLILDETDKAALRSMIIEAMCEAKAKNVATNLVSLLNISRRKAEASFFPNSSHAYTCQIHANGTVTPYDFPYVVGDVKKDSIANIWYSPIYMDFRNSVLTKVLGKDSISTIPFCSRCDYSAKEKDENCCVIF